MPTVSLTRRTRPPTAPRTGPVPAGRPVGSRRAAIGIAVVLVAQLMLLLDSTIVNVALPKISTDLGFGPASLSWVLNAYTLAFGGLLLLGGRLGDAFGRLKVFEAGLALFTLSSLLGGLAQSPTMLIAARAAQGIGAALTAPGVLALVTTSARDEAARHRALALFSAVSVGGGTLGLVLGGLVTEYGSWRWTLFINVPIGIAVLALARRFVTETPRHPGRFDFIGAVTATGAAIAVVWALTEAPDKGWTSPQTIGGLVLAAALATVLARTERRVTHPLLRPDLLRGRRRIGGLVIVTLVFGAQISTLFLLVQYLHEVLAFSPLVAGLAFLPMTLAIFGLSRITPAGRTLRTATAPAHRHPRPDRQLRLARRPRHHQQLRPGRLRPPAAERHLRRTGLHARGVPDRRRSRTRARRIRVRTAPDHPAARRRDRTRRGRLGQGRG